MKKRILMILFGLLLLVPVSAAATESHGYIYQIPRNTLSFLTLFNAPAAEDAVALGGGFYFTNDEAFILKNKNRIVSFPNYELTLFSDAYPENPNDPSFSDQWYLTTINAAPARQKGITGEGVTVAVIDSGLDTDHPDFTQSRILTGYNYTCTVTTDAEGNQSLVWSEDVHNVEDNDGHGTAVTGIIAAQSDNELGIAGIASRVNILPIKVTDGEDLNLASLIVALYQAIDSGCDIINMSLGGTLTNASGVVDQDAFNALKTPVDEALNQGITIIAAAGNGGTDINYPAGFDGVISVAGVRENKTAATYSSQNSSVFIAAPSEGSVTDFCTLAVGGSTTTKRGTSFAAPQVTAAAALIKALKPDCTNAELQTILQTTAEDLGSEGRDTVFGWGLLNIESILTQLQEYLPKYAVSEGKQDGATKLYIHNNTNEALTANVYFARQAAGVLDTAMPLTGQTLAAGVTALNPGEQCDELFVWDTDLRPYIKKYVFN